MTARPLLLGMGWSPDRPGGVNRYVRDLFDALRSAGVDAGLVVTGPASHTSPDVRVAVGDDASLLGRLQLFRSAARRLVTSHDVVDSHFALYGFATLVPRAKGVRTIVHFHGPWAAESAASGERRAAVRLKHALERYIYRRADEVITLSNAFRRVAIEDYGVSPWRARVIPAGVDLERFTPGDRALARSRVGITDDGLIVLTVRRLVPRMGIDVLIDAWAALGEDGLLVIAGDGPLRLELEQRSKEMGVEDSVRFLGRVSEDELLDLYRAADVAVLPSTSLEGFGLVALEALACGTPVVGTDAGGLPEVLRPLQDDLVVRAGDVGTVVSRLEDAISGRRPLPTENECRAYAERFSWPAAVDAHMTSYARAPKSRRRRIVFLDHCAKLSGAEIALASLIPSLGNVDVHVILGEDGPLVGRLLQLGVSVEVLPMGSRGRELRRDRVRAGALPAASILSSFIYTMRVAMRLRRLQPDLVHTNSLKSSLYGGVAGRLAGVPVVWHIQDRIAETYLPRHAVALVREAAKRLPDGVVANSQSTLDTLPTIDAPSAVVPSPVEATRRAPDPSSERALRIGMVGRIAPWKGQHVFLDAFAQAFPEGDETASLVGTTLFGEEQYESSLKERCMALGIADRVAFLGFCDDVPQLLGSFDVIVHASTVPEPFGRVVVEGMAAGVPVIAADDGGPAEIVSDGIDGILYPPGDVDALARALVRLGSDLELRIRLRTNGFETARYYEPDRVARRMHEMYDRVLRAA